MRLILPLAFLVFSTSVKGQSALNDTLIHLENYSVEYSQRFLQPSRVWYTVQCPEPGGGKDIDFTNKIGDSLGVITSGRKHYADNVWDKGHLAPSASLDCSLQLKRETYTFLNCALQRDSLNRGLWKELEDRERELAEKSQVFVYIEVVFEDSIEIQGVRIPSGFFKTLIVDGKAESYDFPNQIPESENLEFYRIKEQTRNEDSEISE